MKEKKKDTRFLDAHRKIIQDLFSEHRDGHISIKNGYAKYHYKEYDIFEITLYVTNNKIEITTGWGCLDFCGMREPYLMNDIYIKKEETFNWGAKEWNTYISKTVKYFSEVISYVKECTSFCFEGFANFLIDYKKFLGTVLKEENHLEWFLNDAIGDYCINAFAAHPVFYDDISKSIENIKIIKSIVKKQESFGVECNEETKSWSEDIFKQKFCKKLTKKEKDLCESYFYNSPSEVWDIHLNRGSIGKGPRGRRPRLMIV